MSINTDSYNTTVGSVFVTKQIETAIKESIIKDGLNNVTLNVENHGNFLPLFVTGALPSEAEIPLFTHPITIFNIQHKNYLCTDLRLFIRKGTPLSEIETGIRNLTEYNFVKSRAILNLIWLNEGTSKIKNSLSFAGVVFSSWLSEVITKTYALDFKDQTILSIISSFYYQTLFTDDNIFDEDTKQKMAVHTIKATKASSDLVFSIFDRITEMESIEDYCKNVVNILENVRLKTFNVAMLLTIIRNSWYGTNSKEILSVAIEHPPTWIAIVYTALTERTFRSSMIYRVAERFGKRGLADEFTKNYIDIVKESTKIANEEIVIRDFE